MSASGYSTLAIWGIILALAIGTFALRYSFMGFLGHRQLPQWALRYLRYTAVAVLPALVAPMVVWPSTTGGSPDPARLLAAAATIAAGVMLRNTLVSILLGFGMLYLGLWLEG